MTAAALIERIDAHPNGTQRIHLRLDGDVSFTFDAGQYLLVQAGGRSIPFSIASSPTRLPAIELHFFPIAGSDDARALQRVLAPGARVAVDGPFGDIAQRGPTRAPLALIAAGTGAAQACAIVDYLQSVAQCEPVRVYWCIDADRSAYCAADFERHAAQHAWFGYRLLIAQDDAHWLDDERAHLDISDAIVCGSPAFVYGVVDAMAERGIAPRSVRSDVFAYAPRER